MRMQGFRGNCDSKGKLGMCPSLAELYAGGFPKTSHQIFHSPTQGKPRLPYLSL